MIFGAFVNQSQRPSILR